MTSFGTLPGWLQIALFAALTLAFTKPLGFYLHRVFEGDPRPWPVVTRRVERFCLKLIGSRGDGQSWRGYALSVLAFSLVSTLTIYALLRLQGLAPFNAMGRPGLSPDLAFNIAASFVTNTNWQNYAGEIALSHFTQAVALTWQNFMSTAVGLGVALALARGLTRRSTGVGAAPAGPVLIGNFWLDLVRALLYVLLPGSLILALLLVSQGVVQSWLGAVDAITLEGVHQVIPLGPVASQEAIKQLGTNGGGFFNANSAHPFENPTPLANLLQMLAIFVIPAALTNVYGRMTGDQRQGWTLFAAMGLLFLVGVTVAYWAEGHPNPALAGLPLDQLAGNLEGKEVRFGIANSALFATITTDASSGAVNAMHDSFTALGGLVPLFNMMLGEVVFGGVGAGLYGVLIMVLLAVFISGLMVGRTPEYLGKKIEAREMTLVVAYVLIFPAIVLSLVGWSAVWPAALAGLSATGPHGFSQLLYAYVSAAANNGSAFAGLAGDNGWYNVTLGIAMLAGRFLTILPVLAIAGAMAGKKQVPPGPGSLPSTGILFGGLLIGVIVIVGALTFLPFMALGPVLDHFQSAAGKLQ